MIVVRIAMNVLPEKQKALVQTILSMIGPMKKEAGCLSYALFCNIENKNLLNQTRSMLDTPQRYPRAGSQSYPSPAAEVDADGSTTIYFSPTQPKGEKRGNWIQTMPGKGWFTILRSTARWSHSSQRSGGRLRSSWFTEDRSINTRASRR
jgi:hypothetical protein